MHQPVLVKEILDLAILRQGGAYIDGTAGSGGHAEAIIRKIGPGGFLLGIDRDVEAVERARKRLSRFEGQFRIVHGNFGDIVKIAGDAGLRAVDGVLLDIGVSSEQLETDERGFSFGKNGPSDMRMDQSSGKSASEVVNTLSSNDLADLIWRYGEEPRARQFAKAIVARREAGPIQTTAQLAETIETVAGGRRGRIHPATRLFQAIRIAVNQELDCLSKGLVGALSVLGRGGRMAVISFHSLEDRIVKRFFVAHAGRDVAMQAGGSEWQGERPAVRLINKKPVIPSASELEMNPRARSAKLRVAEKID